MRTALKNIAAALVAAMMLAALAFMGNQPADAAGATGYPARPRFQSVGIGVAPNSGGGIAIAAPGNAPWFIQPAGLELSFFSQDASNIEVLLRPEGLAQHGADDTSASITLQSTNATLAYDIGARVCATVIASSQCEPGAGLLESDVLISSFDTDVMAETEGSLFFFNESLGARGVCLADGTNCPASEFVTFGVVYNTGDCSEVRRLPNSASEVSGCVENGTGDITLTLLNPYSAAPICTTTAEIDDSGADRISKLRTVTGSTLRVITFDEDGANVDVDVNVVCTGTQ